MSTKAIESPPGSPGNRCPVCDDCPDLVAYWTCDHCGNRAEKEGRARWWIYGKHGEPSGFREPDGSFTPYLRKTP